MFTLLYKSRAVVEMGPPGRVGGGDTLCLSLPGALPDALLALRGPLLGWLAKRTPPGGRQPRGSMRLRCAAILARRWLLGDGWPTVTLLLPPVALLGRAPLGGGDRVRIVPPRCTQACLFNAVHQGSHHYHAAGDAGHECHGDQETPHAMAAVMRRDQHIGRWRRR